MISSFGFQLAYVAETTAVLRIRATVVKELYRRVYTVFVAPKVLVASHVMLLSILLYRKGLGIFGLAFIARTTLARSCVAGVFLLIKKNCVGFMKSVFNMG